MASALWTPLIQCGMGGAFAIVVALLAWQLRVDRNDRNKTFGQLLSIQKGTQEVLLSNTAVIGRLAEKIDQDRKVTSDLYARILQSPCLLRAQHRQDLEPDPINEKPTATEE